MFNTIFKFKEYQTSHELRGWYDSIKKLIILQLINSKIKHSCSLHSNAPHEGFKIEDIFVRDVPIALLIQFFFNWKKNVVGIWQTENRVNMTDIETLLRFFVEVMFFNSKFWEMAWLLPRWASVGELTSKGALKCTTECTKLCTF